MDISMEDDKLTYDFVPGQPVDWKELRKRKKEWKKQKQLEEAKRLLEEKRRLDEEKEAAAARKSDLEGAQGGKKKKKNRHKDNKSTEVNGDNCSVQDKLSGRNWTVSIALPAAILDNAQSAELRSYLAGEIARAATVFNIDEIVIYDEYSCWDKTDARRNCVNQMAKILEYLECPQYLRKNLFPIHPDLRFAGLLNPLDSKHHLKTHDLDIGFREGVTINKKFNESGSIVYIGLDQNVHIEQTIKPGVRVTVQFDPNDLKDSKKKNIPGKAVSPSQPTATTGIYWGYRIRIADSLSEAVNNGPFEYDLKIGTSERGDNVDTALDSVPSEFNHCLIVFGGLKGIEAALDGDSKLSTVDDARSLFTFWINTCPFQGSNTIRTEEAILISLAALRPKLHARLCPS